MTYQIKPLTIENIPSIVEDTFTDLLYDKVELLNLAYNELYRQDSPLNELLKQEFEYYWNKKFAENVLFHNVTLDFPQFITKYPSTWFIIWQNDFDNRYKNIDTQLRGLDFNLILEEKEKLTCFIEMLDKKEDKVFDLKDKLLGFIPYSETEGMHLKVFKIMLFNIALLNSLKNDKNFDDKDLEDETKEILQNIFKCYYSSFAKENEVVSQTSYFNPKNGSLEDIYKKKIEFLLPQSKSEAQLLMFLSESKHFATELNNVFGMRKKDYEENFINTIQRNITSIKSYYKLSDFLPKSNIKYKKIKV